MSRLIDGFRADGIRPLVTEAELADLDKQDAFLEGLERDAEFVAHAASREGLSEAGMIRKLEEDRQKSRAVKEGLQQWPAYPSDLSALMRRAEIVVADDVWGLNLRMTEDIPVAPPFDNLWVELRTPGISRTKAAGFHLVTHDLKEPSAFRRYRQMVKTDSPNFDECRWVVNVAWFTEERGQPRGPFTVWLWEIAEDGRLVGMSHLSGHRETSPQEPRDAGWFGVIWRSLALMHCKNIELVTRHPEPKLSRAHKKRHGVPLTKYRMLDVSPFRRVSVATGAGTGDGQRSIPLHMVRGHFKTYTADRPLFGRVTGTWFWPEHIVGSTGAGTVVKDYRVRVPQSRRAELASRSPI